MHGIFGALVDIVEEHDLVMLNAVAALAFLPAFPLMAAIIIALDILVIWAVLVHGGELKADTR